MYTEADIWLIQREDTLVIFPDVKVIEILIIFKFHLAPQDYAVLYMALFSGKIIFIDESFGKECNIDLDIYIV